MARIVGCTAIPWKGPVASWNSPATTATRAPVSNCLVGIPWGEALLYWGSRCFSDWGRLNQSWRASQRPSRGVNISA